MAYKCVLSCRRAWYSMARSIWPTWHEACDSCGICCMVHGIHRIVSGWMVNGRDVLCGTVKGNGACMANTWHKVQLTSCDYMACDIMVSLRLLCMHPTSAEDLKQDVSKLCARFSMFVCHPCAGAMLILCSSLNGMDPQREASLKRDVDDVVPENEDAHGIPCHPPEGVWPGPAGTFGSASHSRRDSGSKQTVPCFAACVVLQQMIDSATGSCFNSRRHAWRRLDQ